MNRKINQSSITTVINKWQVYEYYSIWQYAVNIDLLILTVQASAKTITPYKTSTVYNELT